MRVDDDRLERALGRVLLAGITISTMCLASGLLLSLAHAGSASLADALLRAGLVALVGTPIARVAASTIGYLLERDWLFVVLTSVVLLELCAAIAAAVHGRG